MPGPLYRFFAEDHRRLEALLKRTTEDLREINRAAYAEFRAGLLKHIAMEEKILLPAAERLRGGEPLPIAAKLRLDHGAIAALLVPSPTPAIVAALDTVLAAHNSIEEGAGGPYEMCEQLAGPTINDLLARLRSAPEVRVAPHMDEPRVIEATRRALSRAGYTLEI